MNVRPVDRMYLRAEEALSNRNLREAEKLAERLLQSTNGETKSHVLWARVLAARGQLHRAIRHLRSVKGETGPALNQQLGRLHHDAGQLEQARIVFMDCVHNCPDDAETWLGLSAVCARQGRLQQAADACTQAISRQPENVQGYLSLGQILQRRRCIDQAIAVYRQGLVLLPDSSELLCDLGAALLAGGRVDAAVETLGQSLMVKPVNHAALFNLGSALMERGDFAAAAQRLEQLLRLRPGMADAWYKLVHCRRQDASSTRHLSQMKMLLGQARLTDKDRARLCFALGKALDDLAEHQAAFMAFSEANAIRAKSLNFNDLSFADRVDRIISEFQPQLFERCHASTHGGKEQGGEKPSGERLSGEQLSGGKLVFIIGLPRSGAGLLNQVLCAHSKVTTIGANERAEQAKQGILQMFSASAPYPDVVQLLNAELIRDLSVKFLDGVPVADRLITDTTTSNFLSLGLLKLLFPAAKIVHLTRSPRDLCLSMFFNDLADDSDYAFDLDHLVAIHAQYLRLIDHWSTLWPQQMHSLSYEDLVSDFDSEIKALFDFLGLQAEPACYYFHTRKNPVATSSSWQVRQPLYNSSVGRWRNYQDQLGPLASLP